MAGEVGDRADGDIGLTARYADRDSLAQYMLCLSREGSESRSPPVRRRLSLRTSGLEVGQALAAARSRKGGIGRDLQPEAAWRSLLYEAASALPLASRLRTGRSAIAS